MPDDPRIRYLGDVQRLALNPGDYLVFTVGQEHIDEATVLRLRSQLESFVGPGHKVLVIGCNDRIGVLGKDDAVAART